MAITYTCDACGLAMTSAEYKGGCSMHGSGDLGTNVPAECDIVCDQCAQKMTDAVTAAYVSIRKIAEA